MLSYKCPMSCEGDKTYTMPGACPVCGMTLVSNESSNRILSSEAHKAHDHSTSCL